MCSTPTMALGQLYLIARREQNIVTFRILLLCYIINRSSLFLFVIFQLMLLDSGNTQLPYLSVITDRNLSPPFLRQF
jgi:hypothetical protein